MSKSAATSILACVAMAGCPQQDPEQGATEAGTSGSSSTTDPTETDTDAPREDVLPPGDPPAAGGIAVDYVEANQGVGVRVGEAGSAVAVEDRTAPLLANRLTLMRVFWTVPDDWAAREIRGEITFYFGDGTTDVQSETKLVEGDSFAGSLDDTFNFGLMEEQAQPYVGYSIELFEVDTTFADPAVLAPPRLPLEGESIQVGIENSYQVMKIVLVPFHYDNGEGCDTEPDTSEETMELFRDFMYMMNPIDRLDVEIHDPVEWNEPLLGFVELNMFMSDLRFEEEAPPETYYYGLVDVCSSGLAGAGGQAYGIPGAPTLDNAFQRVSSGLSLAPDWAAETFVHEVGHSQGRQHVACDGTEMGPDPSYPIEGGEVGEWGFGVIDFRLRHPTFNKDYMTYCHPVWVSTWGWNKVYPTIRTLSEWDPGYPGNAPPGDGEVRSGEATYGGSLLVGALLADGRTLWHTVPGGVDPDALEHTVQVEFAVDGQPAARHGTQVQALPDSDDRLLISPLPTGFDAVDAITWIEDNQRFGIDPAKVRRGHHRRTITR